MLMGYVWDTSTGMLLEIAPNTDLVALKNSQSIFWLDLADPSPDEYLLLSHVFAFHPLAIEDCMHYSQRPKLEQYNDHLFMVSHVVRQVLEESVDVPEVDLFVRDHYVVTVHNDPAILAGVRRRCTDESIQGHAGVDYVVHAILDTLVDSYFPALDMCAEAIDDLEDAVIAGREYHITEHLATLRRKLLTMQHRINPQVDIFARLAQRHFPFVSEAAAPYFRDVSDHATRIMSLLSHYRDLLGHIFEMSLAGAADKTNEVMRRLTVVSTVFLPLTFLVGVYGMNFNYMPELNWRYGYFVIWAVMLVISGGMLASFHKQRWL